MGSNRCLETNPESLTKITHKTEHLLSTINAGYLAGVKFQVSEAGEPPV